MTEVSGFDVSKAKLGDRDAHGAAEHLNNEVTGRERRAAAPSSAS